MLNFIIAVILVALGVAFIWTVLYKQGVWEYLQVHADNWFEDVFHKRTSFFNQMFSCTFCTCWWLSVVLCIVSALVGWDWHYLLIPFCSTPLSKFIL